MWRQTEQRRRLAKSAMAKLVAMIKGGSSNSVLPVVAALEFLSPAFLRLVLRCLLWRSNTFREQFLAGVR